MGSRLPLLLAGLLGLLPGCGDPAATVPCVSYAPTRAWLPAPQEADLLFVVDSSTQMLQMGVTSAFPQLLEALRSPGRGRDDPQGLPCTAEDRRNCQLPSLHVGVISTDMGAGNYGLPTCEVTGGDGGKLQNAPRVPGCTPPKDAHISYLDGMTNVALAGKWGSEQVADAFGCIALLGDSGCGFEHPLEAARRALDPTLNVNPGFMRKDALLGIFWATDEDDCSAKKPQLFDPSAQGLSDPLGPLTSFRCTEFGLQCDEPLRAPGVKHHCVPAQDWLLKIEDYQRSFTGLKQSGRVILAAVAGPAEPVEVALEGTAFLKPSCATASRTATPAVRLKALLGALGAGGHFNEGRDVQGHAVEVSACSEDLAPALRLLGEEVAAKLSPGVCLFYPPATRGGTIACREGDALGAGVSCRKGCLEQAECTVTWQDTMRVPREVSRCDAALFDPAMTTCSGAACPCWRIVFDRRCSGLSPYALEILGSAGPMADPVPDRALATCALPVSPDLGGTFPPFTSLPQCDEPLTCRLQP